MSTIKRIAKNTTVLFVATIVASILGILLSVYIARKVGDINFGKYSFALAFTAFFAIFLDLGYSTLFIRNVARNKSLANNYLNNLFGIRALLSILVFIFVIIIINIMGYPADTKNFVYLFFIYTILLFLSDLFKIVFRVFERMEYEAFIQIITTMIRVALGLLILFLGYGLLELALVFVFSEIVDLLFSFLICEKRFIKSKTEFDFGFLKKTLRIALPLAMLSFFSLIFVRIDTIMLSIMKGDATVGWYNAAYNLTLGFKPIPFVFMTALFPLMAYYHMSSKKSLKMVYEKSFKYMLILGLPLAFGTAILSDKIIILFYGQQFSNSIIALQILAWDVLLIFLYSPLGAILVSIDRQNEMAVILLITAFINIVLNLFLIPHFSYVGSAVATIITEVILLGMYAYFLSKYLHKIAFHKIIIKPIISVSIMCIFVYFCRSINLFLLVILAAVVYFLILYLIKGFSKEDIDLFKNIFKKQKEET